MKKKVLCAFSLIVYLLFACTLLSQKIKTEMTIPVTVKQFPGMSAMGGTGIPMSSFFRDENGIYVFEVVEGSDWESGLRIKENTDWKVNGSDIRANSSLDSKFVLSAPRMPKVGTLVEIVELDEHVPSRYLLVYPEGVPEYELLPANSEISARSGNAVLLQTEDGIRPFMEHKVKNTRTESYGIPGLAGLRELAGESWRVFCLEDVEQFVEALPMVALAAVLVLAPVLLWVCSCCLARDPRKNRWLLAANIGLALAMLAGLYLVLPEIDLPTSLLPEVNILNLGHYRAELSVVSQALETLGDAARDTLALMGRMLRQSAGVLLAGGLAVAAVLVVEALVARRLSRGKRDA